MPERAEPELLPDWGKREKAQDLAWIQDNVHRLWPVARLGYDLVGRGSVVVDTRIVQSGGYLVGYANQTAIDHDFGYETSQFVRDYDPDWEFVTAMLKSQDRISSYRLGLPSLKPREKHNGKL